MARGGRNDQWHTTLIAHIGYPTETFKAPLIYNPYFVLKTASVKGFGCRPVVTYAAVLRAGVRKPPRKEPAGAGWPRRVEIR